MIECCAMPFYPTTNDENPTWGPDSLHKMGIRHPGLRTLVERSPVATKLTTVLHSQQIKQDAYIAWSPFEEKRLAFYSGHGAAVLASDVTVPFLVVAFLTLYWMGGRDGPYVHRIRKACVMTVFGAILFWLPIYLLLPKIPVVIQRRPTFRNWELHQQFVPEGLEVEASEKGTNFAPDITWLHQQLEENSVFRRKLAPDWRTNFFTGRPWREEDSPGNCTVRQTVKGMEYVWYDIAGGEHGVPLFQEKKQEIRRERGLTRIPFSSPLFNRGKGFWRKPAPARACTNKTVMRH